MLLLIMLCSSNNESQDEQATSHIMHLLDRLSPYRFNLYCVKGKAMILTDYLSKH